MARLSTTYPFTCVTCEVEIVGPATFHVGLPFCCAGCVAGGPCTCSYDREPAVDAHLQGAHLPDDHELALAVQSRLSELKSGREPVSGNESPSREPVAQH
jgi:hypothetical protein